MLAPADLLLFLAWSIVLPLTFGLGTATGIVCGWRLATRIACRH